MSNSDGQVRINIDDSDVIRATKSLDDYNAAFEKLDTSGFVSQTDSADNVAKELLSTASKSKTPLQALEQGIRANTEALRNMALSGGEKSEEFKKLAADTKNWQKALDEANAKVKNSIGNFNQQGNAMDKLMGAAKGLVGAYLGFQGVKAVINYSAQAVQAFREQDIAIKQLDVTLKNAGVYTAEYSSHIQNLASEIQGYSNYGDEAVIKAQALAQAYVGNTKITDELTKATVDFAAATGMDLEQAFSLVGKSVGSQTNALARYGVRLEKGMTDSQKMEAIQRQLGQRYEGTARQMANSSTQLKNALSDLAESIGKILNPSVEAGQRAIIKWTNSFIDLIEQVHVARSAINQLGIEELQTKLRQVWVEQDKWNTRFDNMMFGDFARKNDPRLQKLNNEEKAILNQIKLLEQRNKEAVKQSKTNFIKFTDDYNMPSIGGGSVSVQKMKDDYEKLQAAVAAARREIELAAIKHGVSSQEVQNAFTKYRDLNGQLSAINSLFEENKTKTDEQKGAYQQLTDTVSSLTAKLRDLAAEGKIGSDEWIKYNAELDVAQTQLGNVNNALEKQGIKVDEVSKSISANISSGLVSALRNGGNAFEVFGNLAINVLQNILNKILEMAVITPILNSLTGGLGGSLFSFLGFKNGAAFQNGKVIPFARGGVVNQPTIFPMANGRTGLMGEAGAEAVMPLRRMSNGRLGVEASDNKAVEVNIYNQSGAEVETRQKDNGSMDIIIKRVNEALMNERTSSGFRAAYQRESNKGVQAV